MQRDLEFATTSDEELYRAERQLMRDLGDGRGRSYSERQQLALNYLRCVTERLIREEERRLGRRAGQRQP